MQMNSWNTSMARGSTAIRQVSAVLGPATGDLVPEGTAFRVPDSS